MNYIGYFRGVQSNKLYSVKIIADASSSEFTEVPMANNEPFVVKYDDSKTLFEPLRISTATINFVYNEYMLDAFSPLATGTKVVLTNEATNVVMWVGYLKPNLYNQGYAEEYERLSLEASDYLAAMQYYDYGKLIGTDRNVVTFKSIIDRILDTVGASVYAIVDGKKINGKSLEFSDLTISEQNFFTSDTDEGWKCDEIMSEICKYLGYTMVQERDVIYFIDYSTIRDSVNVYAQFYRKSAGVFNKAEYRNVGHTMDFDSNEQVMGSNHSISMENVFNKATVKCSTYKIENAVPDIFTDDDEMVTPMYGDWSNCSYINASTTNAQYVNGKGKVKSEETRDTKYTYVNRFLKHQYYEGVYYDFKMNPVNSIERASIVTEVPSFTYRPFSIEYWSDASSGYYDTIDGSTGCDGSVRFKNNDNKSHTISLTIKMKGRRSWYFKVYDGWAPDGDEIWYSACGEHDGWDYGHTDEEITETFSRTIAAGGSVTIPFSMEFTDRVAYASGSDGKITTNMFPNVSMSATMSIDGAIPTSITAPPFGNGGQDASSPTAGYIGCTLVDYASYEKIPTTVYNFEPTASLNFSRYLCINQHGEPYGEFFSPGTEYKLTPWGAEQYTVPDSKFPCVYRLKSGFKRPMITDENSFIAINADVLYERYIGRNYINTEWTDESTGWNNSIFAKTPQSLGTSAGALILCLGFGNKYWNGSSWQNGKCLFKVPVSTNVDDNWSTDFTKIWNTNFHILNNFSWEEWADAEGYKIPLNGVDCSKEVTFEIHLPTKLQYYTYNKDATQSVADKSLNGFVWISNLTLSIGNKGQDIDIDNDIVYENKIGELIEDSINEGEEISLKINTNPQKGPLSYSYVGLANGGYLETIEENGLGGKRQKPEFNLIERMVKQYSTTTKKESLVVNMDFSPLARIVDKYWDEKFAIVGQEIDYRDDIKTITILQVK